MCCDKQLFKLRCNPRTTCKLTLLAQAYSIGGREDRSIDRSIDRWLLTKEGRRPVVDVFSPSGGGKTSLSLEARKSPASLEELRVVTRSAKLEFAVLLSQTE